MEVIYLNETDCKLEDSCVAMGFFDGFHLGHLSLVNEVQEVALRKQLKRGLLTFDVQPKSYLTNKPFKYLMSLADKINFLEQRGFDYIFVIRFNHEIAKMDPTKFINDYIVKTKIKHVVCGFDFHFGNLGQGNSKLLKKQAGSNYQVSVIEKLVYEHHKISSSYLRKLLSNGEVELANTLLNREYQVSGEVIHGRQNGRKIGFPTANVAAANYVLPKNGVYGVKVYIDGKTYVGMANIGYNPTFKALDAVSLEVNIFDFDDDVYGKVITVAFIKQIRLEKKFPSVAALVVQLKHDQKQITKEIKL